MIFDWWARADDNGMSRGGWSVGESSHGCLEPVSNSMAHLPSGMCNVHANGYFLRETDDKVGFVWLWLSRAGYCTIN